MIMSTVNIHEKFRIQGVLYCEIHFKYVPLARDLIVHCYKNGVEISKNQYEIAKEEHKRLWIAARKQEG
jgi:hypothetical protein